MWKMWITWKIRLAAGSRMVDKNPVDKVDKESRLAYF